MHRNRVARAWRRAFVLGRRHLYRPYGQPVESASEKKMVSRGGAFDTETAKDLRLTFRDYGLPVSRYPWTGFRCAVGD